jgi:tungstate transport system ATP-binding protein
LTLHLEGPAKPYNGRQVLAKCSFTFEAGGAYILRGDNGSGKSTLFRLAALLEPPDRGEVRYRHVDEELAPDLHLKRSLTMVFPKVGVFCRSVFENLAYGLRVRGIADRLLGELVAATLEKVDLTHKAGQPPTTLSSGETMRLGLARALVIEPQVLFLDEPTTRLDRASTTLIEECLLKIREERALTLVMITHDPAQDQRLGGRRLLLEQGGILEV